MLKPNVTLFEDRAFRRRLRLNEVTRVESLSCRIGGIIRRGRSLSLSLSSPPCVHAQEKNHVSTQLGTGYPLVRKRSFTRIQPCQHVISNFQLLELGENKFLLYELPTLWHFIMAERTKKYILILLYVVFLFSISCSQKSDYVMP